MHLFGTLGQKNVFFSKTWNDQNHLAMREVSLQRCHHSEKSLSEMELQLVDQAGAEAHLSLESLFMRAKKFLSL